MDSTTVNTDAHQEENQVFDDYYVDISNELQKTTNSIEQLEEQIRDLQDQVELLKEINDRVLEIDSIGGASPSIKDGSLFVSITVTNHPQSVRSIINDYQWEAVEVNYNEEMGWLAWNLKADLDNLTN